MTPNEEKIEILQGRLEDVTQEIDALKRENERLRKEG